MIKRSTLFLILAATVAALAVVSCARGPVTLTVWDFKFGPNDAQKPMQQIDALFQQKNPGVTINHVAQPGEPQYYQIIQAAATANQGPDVAMFHPGAGSTGLATSSST